MVQPSNPHDLLFFNGINGDSGEYTLPPMTDGELSGFIKGENRPENLAELRARYKSAKTTNRGAKAGVNPLKLEEAGWGVIFAHQADPAIRAALQELLDWRRAQAGDRFHIYADDECFHPDDTKNSFLSRYGAGPGPVDPDKVPYYLLIVGDPQQIPYAFQTQLDVQYAVGRIYFETIQEYASYAHSVVAAEKGLVNLARRAAFFGVANPDDSATQASSELLLGPLLKKLQPGLKEWQVEPFLREQASKAQLTRLLGAQGQPPAFLFTASHGMSFSSGSPRQVPHQGALLCQDWPGPEQWSGAIPPEHYFAGDDVASDANVLGMIAFFFACYGAGTPLYDEFSRQAFKKPALIAPNPFVAGLPMRLLGHPKGGALAVVGHVERAWGYSFQWPGAGAQTTVFESALKLLCQGQPVGLAFECFNERHAELSVMLTDTIESLDYGRRVSPYELSGMWTAKNDARGYVILGDPAARLPVTQPKVEPLRTLRSMR